MKIDFDLVLIVLGFSIVGYIIFDYGWFEICIDKNRLIGCENINLTKLLFNKIIELVI